VNPPSKKRHVRYFFLRQAIDEGVIVAVGHVVEVLHTDDIRDSLRLGELLRNDLAYAKITNHTSPQVSRLERNWGDPGNRGQPRTRITMGLTCTELLGVPGRLKGALWDHPFSWFPPHARVAVALLIAVSL
jgi:hypothetical protein